MLNQTRVKTKMYVKQFTLCKIYVKQLTVYKIKSVMQCRVNELCRLEYGGYLRCGHNCSLIKAYAKVFPFFFFFFFFLIVTTMGHISRPCRTI